MGQFSNGTEGMAYQEQYCDRCIHDAQNDCPVWNAHLMFNSSDVPQIQSILEMLIPQREDGLGNEECSMFMLDPERARGAKIDEQYMLWRKGRSSDG